MDDGTVLPGGGQLDPFDPAHCIVYQDRPGSADRAGRGESNPEDLLIRTGPAAI